MGKSVIITLYVPVTLQIETLRDAVMIFGWRNSRSMNLVSYFEHWGAPIDVVPLLASHFRHRPAA